MGVSRFSADPGFPMSKRIRLQTKSGRFKVGQIFEAMGFAG